MLMKNYFFSFSSIIILVIIISKNYNITSSRDITCPTYKCSVQEMTDSKCLSVLHETLTSKNKVIYNLSSCGKSKKCSLLSWDNSIGLCVPNIRKSFGGEKCSSDLDCFSQACNDHNICQNKELNEKCFDDKECSKEAVCIYDSSNGETPSDKTCRHLVKIGENCILDESDISGFHSNCQVFAVCSNPFSSIDATNGICVEQNSLEVGKNATNFRACKGNNIILIKEGYYVCANISSTEKSCEIASDQSMECQNEIIVKKGQIIDEKEKKIMEQGICRCEIDGNKHCQVIAGVQFDIYINLIKKKIKENQIVPSNFHIAVFRETFNDKEIAEAYFNSIYDVSKADSCTKQYFLDNFLMAFEKQRFIKDKKTLSFLIFMLFL